MSGEGVAWASGGGGTFTLMARFAAAALTDPSTCNLCILSCLSLELIPYDSLNLTPICQALCFSANMKVLRPEGEYLTAVFTIILSTAESFQKLYKKLRVKSTCEQFALIAPLSP